uniref:Large ribosomal subunit protein uL4c n=1 Tax=Anotrichium furcellatum TaxID=41999 RepID=A0A4D6WK89_9FLOR|nr:ribosomal protein L4 [Anotrichium furcellatum]
MIKPENTNSITSLSQRSQSLEITINTDYKQNIYLIHRCVKWQLNQNRQGNANTKTRDEVRGGGKKPWKQKGTGRARAGSSRSPLWKGGGVIFGPRSSRIYKSKINKKEKHLAIKTLLYNKASYTFIIQDILNCLDKPNTKTIINKLTELKINISKNQNILLIVKKKTDYLYQSIKNISNIDIIQANHLNVLALINADCILLTTEGFDELKKSYGTKK